MGFQVRVIKIFNEQIEWIQPENMPTEQLPQAADQVSDAVEEV